MIFCDFFKISKSTFFTESLQVTQVVTLRHIKMTSIEAIIGTLMLTLNVFLSFGITLETAIQNNLTKSRRFSREMSLVEFCYSMKL